MAHFPIVRGSAIDGHGWSAGDARNPLRIIELEMVARVGIESSTRELFRTQGATPGTGCAPT